jgi:hypothetical protein
MTNESTLAFDSVSVEKGLGSRQTLQALAQQPDDRPGPFFS